MSSTKNGMTAEEIDAQIQKKLQQMETKQKQGNYVQAQGCRIAVEQLKVHYQSRRLYELKQQQRKQVKDLQNTHKQEMDSFNEFWNKKEEELRSEGQKIERDLSDRHQEQIKTTSAELNQNLPKKVKESSELLNLRKMEEHLAKQKNYVEAHKVQEKCNQILKQEIENWNTNRNYKIEQAMKKLNNKQQIQLQAVQLRYRTAHDELQKDRTKQVQRLKLKYENVCKELKMQHDKQILSHKGQFKSKGGQATSPSMSRSRTFKN